jgi:class 3 adenylate cyclase
VLYRDTLPPTPEESRGVAALIPQAHAMRVSGSDYWGVFLSLEIVDELERLSAGEAAPTIPESVLTTLLFTDIVGSSRLATEVGDRAWRDLLARHHASVRRELAHFRGQERDTAGDGFFATFDGPARAVRCAQAIAEAVEDLGIEVRAGVHTGEIQTVNGKVGGIAVSIGARISSKAGPSEVLVSSTVKDLVSGSGLAFDDAGEHELKGVPGSWHLYRAV